MCYNAKPRIGGQDVHDGPPQLPPVAKVAQSMSTFLLSRDERPEVPLSPASKGHGQVGRNVGHPSGCAADRGGGFIIFIRTLTPAGGIVVFRDVGLDV